jgi:uncharacterized protein (DUF2252 family)
VKDVAIKTGSGTASLGLDRYYVLIDGETQDPTDDILLEIKQARRSALYGLTAAPPEGSIPAPPAGNGQGGEGSRVVYAHRIHVAGGDRYYGEVSIDGESFLVREFSPFKGKIDLQSLSRSELREYAHICGTTLAQVHARSDEDTGAMKGQAETRILESIRPTLFRGDVVRFAEEAARGVYRDYAFFSRDHKKGAFQFMAA